MPPELAGRQMIAIGLTAWVLLASVCAIVLFAIDKHRARRGGWRIPESRLHLVEWLGGWPGAFIAMWLVRHKRRKPWYVAQTIAAAITWVIAAAWFFVGRSS